MQRAQLRIIGGIWRGRRIPFPPLPGVRPTPDRVRETLFNWLQPQIVASRCLDLFAGSGALGLEALSRQAAEVVFVDSAPGVATAIRDHLSTFGTTQGEVVTTTAERYLQQGGEPFDLIFVDPPFSSGMLPSLLTLIGERGWLRQGGSLYLESEQAVDPAWFAPFHWQIRRQKRAGQVYSTLVDAVGEGG
ncbi:MAG: 16S rRNA (guanine(966)-N(2))-methyltransferase RsmD [Gammaproteobacteria bacterium]|nr:16S rRNA (guanine(966)-N(2))-methyltransferase RsmD [Gammaproteobacteria bacterium]